MNIPAFQAAARAAGNSIPANPQPAQPRQQPAAPPSSASPSSAPNVQGDPAQRAPETRPVLDLSDTALTRRDIPRGSVLDIIA
tara:strand:- start:12233 stop:12481 length:249 start_codon:yes stop_codon:yes gene_type:complete